MRLIHQIDYEIGQDNVQIFGLDIHNPVFGVSALIVVLVVTFALYSPDLTASLLGDLRPWLTNRFDWLFMIAGNVFVLFCLVLVVSPLGRVRLGGPKALPSHSYPAWLAMLFAAGMGIGLMFFGVLEPVAHFRSPPLGVDPADLDAARDIGVAATIFHWGLHAWAVYAVVALSLAFFTYNHGLPLTIRSAFYPVFGDRVWGWFGHFIDILAVYATLFGLATSLGYGAEQAAAGLNYLFGLPDTGTTRVILIVVITGAALLSVVAGLEKGVKRLSEGNMALAFVLMIFVIIVGPTLAIGQGFFNSLGHYARNIIPLSNWIGREDTEFMHGWTTFYWAWWISWSPFVGMFIARVSRGRTVREFIICVLLVPTLVCVLWMNAFGGTAISQFMETGYTGVTEAVATWTPELALFKMLEPLPLSGLLSFIGILLVVVFFVTSADSGSLVIDTITAGGKLDPPVIQRVFWCIFQGLIAIALLLGGGLGSLQAAAVATGFPFAIVLLMMCWGTFQGLRREPR